nr:hypothetical protein [Lactococcus protaetiae]
MIKLTKMTKKSFEDYMATSVEIFANEKVENGTWDKANSISNSKKEYDRLLPKDSKHQIIISTQFYIMKK